MDPDPASHAASRESSAAPGRRARGCEREFRVPSLSAGRRGQDTWGSFSCSGGHIGAQHVARRRWAEMRLLLIGAPGAGKGTQAELLAERLGITHISSGDLLRQHVRDQTSIGQTIKAYVDAGDLVPDSVVLDMLRKPVVAAAESGGYVLDG